MLPIFLLPTDASIVARNSGSIGYFWREWPRDVYEKALIRLLSRAVSDGRAKVMSTDQHRADQPEPVIWATENNAACTTLRNAATNL